MINKINNNKIKINYYNYKNKDQVKNNKKKMI